MSETEVREVPPVFNVTPGNRTYGHGILVTCNPQFASALTHYMAKHSPRNEMKDFVEHLSDGEGAVQDCYQLMTIDPSLTGCDSNWLVLNDYFSHDLAKWIKGTKQFEKRNDPDGIFLSFANALHRELAARNRPDVRVDQLVAQIESLDPNYFEDENDQKEAA